MTLRERLEWIFRMALLLFVLSSVAFLSALTAMRFAIHGREVTMPDLSGVNAKQAQQILRGRSLGMKIEDRVYSGLAVDAIVRQSPPANERVKTGQYAHVVISLGPQKVSIPSLKDLSLRAAEVELLRSGMQLGEVSSLYIASGTADSVVQQDPAPGTTDVQSPHVNLLITLGPRPPAYEMPELVGLTLAEAQTKLAGAGLKPPAVTQVESLGATAGTVIAQMPARGQRVGPESAVELQISQ